MKWKLGLPRFLFTSRSRDPRHRNCYDKCGDYWIGHEPLLIFYGDSWRQVLELGVFSRLELEPQVEFTKYVGQIMKSRKGGWAATSNLILDTISNLSGYCGSLLEIICWQ